MKSIRAQGFAVSKEARRPGAYSVVAPVHGAGSRVVASLTIAGPLYRLDGDSLDEHVSSVKQAAAAISRKIRNG